MSLAFYRLTLLVFLCCLLLACQTEKNSTIQPALVEDLNLSTQAVQNQKINDALSLLEHGNWDKGSLLINDVLAENPQHRLANHLKKQLTLSSKIIFKTEKFTKYQVKKGDSLGLIAKRWLGDPLYFVSLAKLNNIISPAQLEQGIIIKIPLIKSNPIAIKDKQQSEKSLLKLNKHLKEKQYLKGLKLINTLFVLDSDQEKLNQIQTQLLVGYEQSSQDKSEQQRMLEECNLMLSTTKNPIQKNILEEFISQLQVKLLIDESKILFKNNQLTLAAEKLIHAKKIKPANSNLDELKKIENEIIDKLHEQAIINYRNQKLQEALEQWTLIKQLQPDNKLANKYIERTNKLLNKLDQY